MATPLPARNILDGSSTPTTSTMKTSLGALRDFLADLLGTTGVQADALTALGALPKAGGTLTGAINQARSTVAATATTTPLWTITNGNVQDWTGAPTITNFPAAAQAGATRIIYPATGTIFTHAGALDVQGAQNYTVAAGDQITVEALTTTTFKIWIDKKDGTSVISSGIATKLITDSTDIALNIYSGGTVYSAVGSSFSANIPANGIIKLASFAGRILAGSLVVNSNIGIRIGTTNYWFGKHNDNGVITVDSMGKTPASTYTEWDGSTVGQLTGSTTTPVINGSALDVAAMSIPSGVQTVQLIMATVANASTLKGTLKQTRTTLEFIG